MIYPKEPWEMPEANGPKTKPGKKLNSFGKNCLLLFLSLVFALGICEITLRFYNPLGFRIKGDNIVLPRNRRETLYHDKCTKIDKVVVRQNNSLGFTGEEPPPDFAEWLTIITVGGSTTECFELAPEKSWPHVMEVKLKEHCRKVWVNNAGFGGHSTFGHYILIRDFLSKMKPKVIVFLLGINDIGISDAREYDTRLINKLSFRSLEKFLSFAAYYSEVVSVVLNLYRYYFPKSTLATGQRDMGELDLTKVPELAVPPEERSVILKTHQKRYVPPFAGRLARLIQICRQNNIEPVFVTQPLVYGDLVDDASGINLGKKMVMKGMNGAVGWEVMELYNEATRRIARQEGVFVVDLAGELPKSSRYYYDLMHFSNAGAAQVGEIIAKHLWPYLAEKYQDHCLAQPPRRGAGP